jgi:hypothetical protein
LVGGGALQESVELAGNGALQLLDSRGSRAGSCPGRCGGWWRPWSAHDGPDAASSSSLASNRAASTRSAVTRSARAVARCSTGSVGTATSAAQARACCSQLRPRRVSRSGSGAVMISALSCRRASAPTWTMALGVVCSTRIASRCPRWRGLARCSRARASRPARMASLLAPLRPRGRLSRSALPHSSPSLQGPRPAGLVPAQQPREQPRERRPWRAGIHPRPPSLPVTLPRACCHPSPWPPIRTVSPAPESRCATLTRACAAARPRSTRFGAGSGLTGV